MKRKRLFASVLATSMLMCLAMTLYETSFSQRRMGYASAISWVMFVIIIALTVFIFATSDRWTYYNDER